MEPDSTLYVNQSDFTTAYADYTAVWRVGKVFQSPECFFRNHQSEFGTSSLD